MKAKVDYNDYYHVERSFIATCNAKRWFDIEPEEAAKRFIEILGYQGRTNAKNIAKKDRTKLIKKYQKWSTKQLHKQNKLRVIDAAIEDDEMIAAAIELLNENGFTVYRRKVEL